MELEYKVLDTIKRYRMLEKGDRVLIAVSGGPDSIFLLHVLHAYMKRLGIKISVANADHGLRGEASRKDSRFVKNFVSRLNLKVFYKRLKLCKRNKLSLEEAARAARYEFFEETAKKNGANAIATGHNLDDQAETVLMRIIKGASLKGAAGIPPVRQKGGIKFIRPLICAEKKEIVKALTKDKIPFRTDQTNTEERFLRNKIRIRVIPYLARYNPRIKRALFNLAESLREDYDFIEGEKKKLKKLVKGDEKLHCIYLKNLIMQPRTLQKEVIRDVLKIAGANIKKLTFRHWQEMKDFISVKQSGKSIDLPGGVRMSKEKDRLQFFRLPSR